MAFQNYVDLKLAINEWTHRDDLYSVADSCIKMVESAMNQKLRLYDMEESTTTTTTADSFTLPSDFLEMRGMRRDDYLLRYVTLDVFYKYKENSTTVSTPFFYTINENTVYLFPTPSTSHTYKIDYYKEIPGLSESNTTNFILEQFPQVYMHGCMYFAGIYTQDSEMAQAHKLLFDDELRKIQAQDAKRKNGIATLTTDINQANGAA